MQQQQDTIRLQAEITALFTAAHMATAQEAPAAESAKYGSHTGVAGIQVLTAVQRVLGAVRMQQQRDTTRPQHGSLRSQGSQDFSMYGSSQKVAAAERAEKAAQQAVKALQRKEAVWEAELHAAQSSSAQLHKQVWV